MSKIGLIGCGMVADYGHVPAILQVLELKLDALYDPDAGRAARMAERFNIPHWFAEAEPFFKSGIDAVTITSSAPAHKQNVLDAARFGKHVLCEKPLALNETDAQEMIDAMHKANRMLFVAFCYRFSQSALQIRDLIRSGAIGKVRSLRLIYNWDCHGKYERRGLDGPIEQKRRAGRMLEDGPMMDCGTHQTDLARWWTGSEIVRVTAAAAWVDKYEAPDHIYAHLDHADGAHTLVEISYSYGFTAKEPCPHFVYEIIGTDGIIRYHRELKSFEMRTAAGITPLPWHEEKDFAGMYRAFAKALATGEAGDLPTAEDGLTVTRIARTATDQAIAGRLRTHE
jgi:predicted dehydrogenase